MVYASRLQRLEVSSFAIMKTDPPPLKWDNAIFGTPAWKPNPLFGVWAWISTWHKAHGFGRVRSPPGNSGLKRICREPNQLPVSFVVTISG